MARSLAALLLLSSIALSSGCAMCCAPNDCDYLYQGGAWVRHNPSSGRVGSAFDEAGGPAMLASADSPTPAEPLPATRGAPADSLMPREGDGYLMP
jgi:hypothetical protein